MPIIKRIIFAISTILIIFIVTLFILIYLSNRELDHLINTLHSSNSNSNSAIGYVDFKKLNSLPAPVQKYFRMSLIDGQRFIRKVHIIQKGKLKLDPKSIEWSYFTANQYISSLKPGFIWDSKIIVGNILNIKVIDSYINGKGKGSVLFLSALTIAEDKDKIELNSGALYRYLAEAVWHPTALLPEIGIQWTPIDEKRALATLTDKEITVSIEFTFNKKGEIVKIYTEDRYGLFEGKYTKYPWEGKFSNYVRKDGIMIPSKAEIGWHLPGGYWLFWKANIKELNY